MNKTVCELFAGVGGFRCGLNRTDALAGKITDEKWKTVWFSQWEPSEKTTQYAHDCYVYRFGTCLDLQGADTTNDDISKVDKTVIPDSSLLVGGFPCQDYSVASSLATSKGLEGKKGVLWWSVRDVLETKRPPFVLLENVDRLLKSPASQRGRDFGIILACLRDEGYIAEWRVINAADYGYQQRRRRIFIFAYKRDTEYGKRVTGEYFDTGDAGIAGFLSGDSFFSVTFPTEPIPESALRKTRLPSGIGSVSDTFRFDFENCGVMKDGVILTAKAVPCYSGTHITLGDVMDTCPVSEEFFIPPEKLYYTDPGVDRSDETAGRLSQAARQTWQYLKGAKKIPRRSKDGHEYIFSEGAVAMIDAYDKPARTMLTSEGSFSRTTHLVRDMVTGRIRRLTPTEAERIQGFPADHTRYYLDNGTVKEVPVRKRLFMMGNALVVDLVRDMEKTLSDIFEKEP